MEHTRAQLTVFFEDPFWVGLYERQGGDLYQVCRIVFGAEPTDSQVYQYLKDGYARLRFSPALAAKAPSAAKANPKRLQRQAKKELQTTGGPLGTKAQQALKLQQEEGKLARQSRTKAQREAEAQRQFALHQEKRKEKHRGH